MPKSITVFGAGLVGNAIIRDLGSSGYRVCAVDLDAHRLDRLKEMNNIKTMHADITDDAALEKALRHTDLAVCAVPGSMGFETLRRLIERGVDVVDISFFPEDAFDLDDLARERGVTAIVDCGVAPGLCNMQAGYTDEQLDRTHSYVCYVGGLPQTRELPYEYRAVFSPADVLEEYTRPARFVEGGNVVTREALSDLERFDLPGVDTLEAFNTDGLRSLIHTMDIPDMREKTMRYPGHAELMRIFRESGFLSEEPVPVDGHDIRPLSVTSRLLFDAWKLRQHDRDLTVMRVEIRGERNGREWLYRYDLLDFYDEETGVHSMARTTGYTCTAAVHLLIDGTYSVPGISPPEYLGRSDKCYEQVTDHLRQRGVSVRLDVFEVDS